MTNEKLIAHFESMLEKTKAQYGDDERFDNRVKFAEGQLEAVRAGGIEALKKFWAEYN